MNVHAFVQGLVMWSRNDRYPLLQANASHADRKQFLDPLLPVLRLDN